MIEYNLEKVAFNAKMLRNFKRQGKNLISYGKNLATKPVSTLGKTLRTAGSNVADAEKRFDVLENAIDSAITTRRKGGKSLGGRVVNFSALDAPDPNANIFKRGIHALRQRGILSAGRRTTGTLTPMQQGKIRGMMQQKGLLHRSADGSFAVHRDASPEQLKEIYDTIQKMSNPATKKNIGAFSKIRNATNYIPLPGERGMFLGGLGLAAGGELLNKQTQDGRKRGIGERIARAGVRGVTDVAMAPIGIANRLYGGAGMAAEMLAQQGLDAGLNRVDKAIAKKRPPLPQQMPSKLASLPKNPRQRLRGILK